MPEHSCTFHVSCAEIVGTTHVVHFTVLSAIDAILWRNMTMWRHDVTSHDVLTSHHRPGFCITPFKSDKRGKNCLKNHIFSPGDLDLWPMTLISNGLGGHPGKNYCPYVQWFNRESMDTQTNTQILLPRPLTREVIILFIAVLIIVSWLGNYNYWHRVSEITEVQNFSLVIWPGCWGGCSEGPCKIQTHAAWITR